MGILSWISKIFLEVIIGKIASFFANIWRFLSRKEEIKKQEQDSVKPLKDAKTAEEIDRAADDALNNF